MSVSSMRRTASRNLRRRADIDAIIAMIERLRLIGTGCESDAVRSLVARSTVDRRRAWRSAYSSPREVRGGRAVRKAKRSGNRTRETTRRAFR